MQWYSGPEGDQRIWYEATELARIAEDELRRAHLMPTLSNPVTDLERFIEIHLKATLDQYADLPADVLGVTEFVAGRPPAVSINGNLTDAAEPDEAMPGLHGRWRATLAHEASHILFHRYLFEPELAGLVSGRMADHNQLQRSGHVRCLRRDVVPTASAGWNRVRQRSDWREVQANRGMATLLMPERLFKRVAHGQAAQRGPQEQSEIRQLTTTMAEIFNVSKQAAGIRLAELEIIDPQDG